MRNFLPLNLKFPDPAKPKAELNFVFICICYKVFSAIKTLLPLVRGIYCFEPGFANLKKSYFILAKTKLEENCLRALALRITETRGFKLKCHRNVSFLKHDHHNASLPPTLPEVSTKLLRNIQPVDK